MTCGLFLLVFVSGFGHLGLDIVLLVTMTLFCTVVIFTLTDGIHSSHIHVVLQVVIMLVIDKENDRALLSRQSRFVPRMWSCLAGFIEVQITAYRTVVIHSCV